MVAIPGDTSAEMISAIIADEMAIGVINKKATAARLIPAPGKKAGDRVHFGGLLGEGPVIAVNRGSEENRFVIGADAVVHTAEGGVFGATEWNQATIIWGAAGMALYLNGEPVATDDHADGLVGNRSRWMFGAADTGDGVGDFFHGELDDIALYGEQLDTAAVHRLFQVGVIGMMDGEGAAINSVKAQKRKGMTASATNSA